MLRRITQRNHHSRGPLGSPTRTPVPWLGAASLLVYGACASFVTGPQQTPWWLGAYALSWALYLTLFLLPRAEHEPLASPATLLLWALLARLLLAGTEPWLSGDLYRYLLDGRVFAAGINPFRHAPSDPAILALAPELVARVQRPEMPTVHPPLVQLVGLAAAWLKLGPFGWRVITSVVDVGAMAAVAQLFGGKARGWRAAAVYGLCPLAVWEAGANGHLEPLAALPLVVGLWAWRRHRPWWGGLALGAAVLVRYYPLLLVPSWIRERGFWKVALVLVMMVGGSLLLFSVGDVEVFQGLRNYLAHWSFNSPLYGVMVKMLRSDLAARMFPFVAVGMAGVIAAGMREDPRRSAPFLLFGFLVAGPTLHPWYALWVLPWLGDRPHTGLWAFVAAMGGAYAAWWQMAKVGVWDLPPGVGEILWSIVALGWLAALWKDHGTTPSPV